MEKTIITSNDSSFANYYKHLWKYRYLTAIFAWRDVSVRYKQTVLGILWTVIRPALTIIIFTIIFDKIAKLASPGNLPYPLLVFAGMLPWLLFSGAFSAISDSLVVNSQLISKIYFPKLIIPLSTLVLPLIEFFISLFLFLILMMVYGQPLSLKALMVFPLALLTLIISIGPGLIISTLNVNYRDFRHLLPFLLQLFFYISPVGYSTEIIPQQWAFLISLNPLVGIIESFRWCFTSNTNFPLGQFYYSLSFSLVAFLIGMYFFIKNESEFADTI